jgi:predicted ATPase
VHAPGRAILSQHEARVRLAFTQDWGSIMTANSKSRFIVITGGPGSGKTALINALRAAGYASSIEAGRAIIQDQVSIGGSALPWQDRLLYSELMASWELQSWRLAGRETGPVFFDRGLPDVLGYLRLIGVEPPAHLKQAVRQFRYDPRVFIAPPWPEIYATDNERRQDFSEAVRTFEVLAQSYLECGYTLIELPKVSIRERLAFVIDEIGCYEFMNTVVS